MGAVESQQGGKGQGEIRRRAQGLGGAQEVGAGGVCQLANLPTFRLVGKLESWRGAGAGAGERNGYRVGAEMKRKGQADGLPGGVSEGGTSWPR